jgi:hypothetical protein
LHYQITLDDSNQKFKSSRFQKRSSLLTVVQSQPEEPNTQKKGSNRELFPRVKLFFLGLFESKSLFEKKRKKTEAKEENSIIELAFLTVQVER